MSSSAMNSDAHAIKLNETLDPSIVVTPEISEPWTLDKVLATIHLDKPSEDTHSPVPYFHILERLKTTKRAGWMRVGINHGESIADHMYRMALMTMVAPPSLAARLDLHKCMKMCLIHDMAESLVGDITPADRVPKTEKGRRESITMDYITKQLLGNVRSMPMNIGEDIQAIWREHEDSETLESHFVQDLDKVELLLQMVEYEKRGEGKVDLSEFTYVATKISMPEMKAWAEEILKEREEFWARNKLVQAEAEENGEMPSDMKKMQDEYYDG